MLEDFDLFGEPVRERRGEPGRPSHVPTDENRNKIMLLFACGWKKEAVAAALKLSMPTFRKHYFSEIKMADVALLRGRARQIERLNRQAEQGNVAAEKMLAQFFDRAEARAFDLQDDEPAPKQLRTGPMGKKEAALLEAQEAGIGSDWGNDLLGPQARPN